MMSYQMQISKKSRVAGRFISKVHKELQRAFSRSGMKQQELAIKLEMDRSAVNKKLLGKSNLTLRSIAELADAMDHKIVFHIEPKHVASRDANRFETRSVDTMKKTSDSVPSVTSTSKPHSKDVVKKEVAYA